MIIRVSIEKAWTTYFCTGLYKCKTDDMEGKVMDATGEACLSAADGADILDMDDDYELWQDRVSCSPDPAETAAAKGKLVGIGECLRKVRDGVFRKVKITDDKWGAISIEKWDKPLVLDWFTVAEIKQSTGGEMPNIPYRVKGGMSIEDLKERLDKLVAQGHGSDPVVINELWDADHCQQPLGKVGMDKGILYLN